jgi:hypothetical protein
MANNDPSAFVHTYQRFSLTVAVCEISQVVKSSQCVPLVPSILVVCFYMFDV